MDKKIKYVIDTNAVIDNPNLLDKYDVVIPSIVLKELEDLELKKSNQVLQYGICNVKRILLNYVKENKVFDDYYRIQYRPADKFKRNVKQRKEDLELIAEIEKFEDE